MEIRKYPEVDVRRRTDIYFMVGLVISLGLTIGAFSIGNRPEKQEAQLFVPVDDEVEEMTDITRQDEPPPPPPPPPEQIEVIEDDSEEEEETIESTEISQETVIEPVITEQVEVVEETKEDKVFMVVEQMPEFPGGEAAMLKYIADNVNYPPLAKENNIQGRVIVQFVVDENGRITNLKVARDIGWGCGEEALRVVKSMPRWKPGKQRNKAVRVQYALPIKFELN